MCSLPDLLGPGVWEVACGGVGMVIIDCEWFGRAGLIRTLLLVWLVMALCARLFVSGDGLQRKDTGSETCW